MRSIVLGDLPRLKQIERLLNQRKAIKRQNKEVSVADTVNNAGPLKNRFLECLVPPKHINKTSGKETKLELTPDTIYEGHALEILKSFPAESVDCVVTSPPYFGLRCYGTEPVIWNGDKACDHEWKQERLTGQKTAPTKYKAAKEAFKPTESAFCSKCGAFKGELGGEPTPELFISHLCDIFDEVKRVLKPTGTCFVNLADGYDKNRSLVGIPEMFVLEMKKRGWTYRNNIVWHKTNCLPESCRNRFTRDFEHLFFFTKKSTGYYYEQQLEPCSPNTLKENRAPSVDRQRSYNSKYNRCDFRPGSASHKPDSLVKAGNCAVSGNQSNRSDRRNKRCVWSIPTANSKEAHFATFPEALVETPIKAGCPEGGLVLDPFVGTGTTCKVAQDNARQYVGIELNPDFIEIAAKRLDEPTIVWTSKNPEEDASQFNEVILGDCLEKLKSIPDNSVDLIATDPPYGLTFMNKNWDRAVPKPEIWKQCHRVLKPGAFALVMCAPRQDCLARMIVNLQDAGFDTSYTSLYWTYASGFPKAHNISKAIDKKFGAERKVIGKSRHNKSTNRFYGEADSFVRGNGDENFWNVTAAATEEAKKFEGAYAGFQPKPAAEVIIVAMKPLEMKTYADQALSNGKGVTWMDDCRIPYVNEAPNVGGRGKHGRGDGYGFKPLGDVEPNTDGRFPANLLVSDDVLDEFSRYFSIDVWLEVKLPFLIVPKPTKKEKGEYNYHETVKPIRLMAYLTIMFSSENDVVLDPFCGSGTTCVAAKLVKRRYIGIELEPEYHDIAVRRIEATKPMETDKAMKMAA